MAVLDVDPRNGGDRTLAALLQQHTLPRTVSVATPRGGFHYYFSLPVGVNLKPYTKIGPGLEVLSSRWNILLPGSVGDNGRNYAYTVSPSESDVAPTPQWLLQLALEKGKLNRLHFSTAFSLPERIPEGTRFNTLRSYAGSLRARGYKENDILTCLTQVNEQRCIPPLPTNKVEDIAAWIGQRPPGHASSLSDADRAVLDTLDAAIAAHVWKGRFARGCRRVVEDLAVLMRQTHKTTVDVDCRSLAQRLGRNEKTVSGYLRALTGRNKEHPAIPRFFYCHTTSSEQRTFTQQGPKQFSNAYSVAEKIAKSPHNILPPPLDSKVCGQMAISDVHDAFRGKYGMSESRDAALKIIEKSEVTSAAKLVELSQGGLLLHTAQRSLKELKTEKLIEKKEGVYRRTDRPLDVVAEERGSAGAADRQRRQHEYERERYAEYLAMVRDGKARRLVTVPLRDSDDESVGVVSEPVVISLTTTLQAEVRCDLDVAVVMATAVEKRNSYFSVD